MSVETVSRTMGARVGVFVRADVVLLVVGDSEALIIAPDSVVDLTRGQRRKPLVGSGKAEPHAFFARRTNGTLLLGTDGLFKYVPRERIIHIARQAPFASLLDELVGAVRLPSGALQDDVGLVALRTEGS